MLIRTQNKRSVIVLENKSSLFVEKFQNYPYGKLLGELSFIQADNKIIGIYETEERAIAVLGEICNYYKSNENVVFQMPEV